MLGKERVIKWTTITLMISLGIIWILVIVLLLPAILEGPDRLHSLLRAECKINNIRYLDNLCKRDTSEDFSNLIYKDDWEICKVVQFDVVAVPVQSAENEHVSNVNCTWTYPDFFETEKDALFAVSGEYRLKMNYNCVVDIVNQICYLDIWVCCGGYGDLIFDLDRDIFVCTEVDTKEEGRNG
jgi:hypothetical protein